MSGLWGWISSKYESGNHVRSGRSANIRKQWEFNTCYSNEPSGQGSTKMTITFLESKIGLGNQALQFKLHSILCLEELNGEAIENALGTPSWRSWICWIYVGLEAKVHERGKTVIKTGDFKPSTQTRSVCGHRQDILLPDRFFGCESCSSVSAAACNIKSWGINSGQGDVKRSTTAVPAWVDMGECQTCKQITNQSKRATWDFRNKILHIRIKYWRKTNASVI